MDLQIIKNYIKNAKYIIAEEVEILQLLQSKLYLKIISIPYLWENTNTSITSEVVKDILKKNHIFDNIMLALRLWIIKVSLKSDMAIIWIDIWDIQSSNKAKGLINKYFNIESYIATIRDANMSFSML